MSTPTSEALAPSPVTEDPAAIPAPAAAEPAPVPPVTEPAAPQGVTMTNEQLTERMERYAQAQMEKRFGTRDAGQLEQMLADGKAATTKAEEARRAELSENEQLKEQILAMQGERDAATEAASEAQFERAVAAECAALGIKDTGYAMFRLEQHAGTIGDGELDVAEFLKGDIEANRGGYKVDAPVEMVDAPASTGHSQIAPVPDDGPAPAFDATKATPEEYRAHKASMGL